MRVLTTLVLTAVLLLYVPTWDYAYATGENYNAYARYRTRHHTYRVHRVRDIHRDSPDVSRPDNAMPRTSVVWTEGSTPTPFSFITATLVLDARSGRRPVIGALDCGNPDIDWYLRRGLSSWNDFQQD